MSEDPILSALSRLESGVATLTAGQANTTDRLARMEAGQDKMRVDMMARMDEHADQLTAMRDALTVTMGSAAHTISSNTVTRSDIDYLIKQVIVMEQQILRLQTRVNDIAGKP